MPDDQPAPKQGTDMSDVLIAFAASKYFWAAVALFLIVLSGWASPENVTEFAETTLRAWRCG